VTYLFCIVKPKKQYKMKAHNLFFMSCHLAGRMYHDADMVWDDLKIGQVLRLERDPENKYDANAIQVIFNKDGEDYLLGFIPRSDNEQMAAFLDMDYDEAFECRISQLNPDTHPEQQIQLTIRLRRNEKRNSDR